MLALAAGATPVLLVGAVCGVPGSAAAAAVAEVAVPVPLLGPGCATAAGLGPLCDCALACTAPPDPAVTVIGCAAAAGAS